MLAIKFSDSHVHTCTMYISTIVWWNTGVSPMAAFATKSVQHLKFSCKTLTTSFTWDCPTVHCKPLWTIHHVYQWIVSCIKIQDGGCLDNFATCLIIQCMLHCCFLRSSSHTVSLQLLLSLINVFCGK